MPLGRALDKLLALAKLLSSGTPKRSERSEPVARGSYIRSELIYALAGAIPLAWRSGIAVCAHHGLYALGGCAWRSPLRLALPIS